MVSTGAVRTPPQWRHMVELERDCMQTIYTVTTELVYWQRGGKTESDKGSSGDGVFESQEHCTLLRLVVRHVGNGLQPGRFTASGRR